MSELASLFKPASIAIVGVSNDPTKLGSVILSNLLEAKYDGDIYPVNPKYDEVFGYTCYPSISEIPGDVEMIVVVIPAPYVNDIMLDAGKKGVSSAVIITAGFKEVGGEGTELEKQILKTAQEHGIRILGPNCLGLITPHNRVNVSFAASQPYEGNVAFLSQSGAFCTAVLDMSLEKQLGFSHFVSMGNKSDITENEIIRDWLQDDEVNVMGAYLEEIADGQELLQIMHKNDAEKPLIVFKPGKTQEAKQAISSHTGSMAGSIQTTQTAMRQAGIIEATEMNLMFYLMMGFSWAPIPKGKRVAIITNAGGPGIIATDEVIEHGLEIAQLSDETKAKLKESLPPTASVHNPIDVIGDALAERYKTPINILMEDENVDAILVLLTPQLVTQIEETAKYIIDSAKLSSKPIFPIFLGGKYVLHGLQRLYDNKIPGFRYISTAIKVLKQMYNYGQFIENKELQGSAEDMMSLVSTGQHKDELKKYLSDEAVALPEDLSIKLAKEAGIDLPGQTVAHSYEEAREFAHDKYPVVIKATSEVIAHKTDDKAIYLNITDDETLKLHFTALAELLKTKFGQDTPEILIQEHIQAEQEVFIGSNRDGGRDVYEDKNSGFGHLLAFGQGGIYTEIFKDIAYALTPATRYDISSSLEETKIFSILAGARGQDPLAIEKTYQAIEAVQKLVLLYPEIESLDINPLLVTKERAVAVDVKIFVRN